MSAHHTFVRTRVGEVQQGRLRIALCAQSDGLLVEREVEGRDGVNRLSVHGFHRALDFDRWWNTDPIRFANPLLHEAVRRDAADLSGELPYGDGRDLLAG